MSMSWNSSCGLALLRVLADGHRVLGAHSVLVAALVAGLAAAQAALPVKVLVAA